MKAVVYQKPGEFILTEKPEPVLEKETDAVVRVTLAAICSSDLHILHGSVPKAAPGVTVGHEIVGVVEKTGCQVKKFRPGDRVAVNVETFCGECFYCKRGSVNNCEDENGGWALGCRIDGGQAEYVRVPFADNGLTRIPEGVSDEQAVFTGDLLSTGYWGAKISRIRPGDTVAVLGAGPAGICAMLCSRLYSPSRIIAVDTDRERLELVLREKIADAALNPEEENIEEAVKKLTCGRGADIVMEAAGGKNTFETAWKSARPGGVVCVIAMYEEPQVLPLPDMYGKNLTFLTGGVDACDCGKIMELIAEGKLDATCLITHRFPLKEAMKAYQLFEKKQDHVMKILLKP